ncbi:helix-turn-helix transcriptional regulator [Bacteroides sp. 519]|uniref:S24 family peptidase n=1 Tax=Bacteroides sp. 519 TaxID=2302937 RepID=UPI0013D1108B|nr:helix-turn-helix transcriptional regulator [Bacteroides sp. 519]NDV57666.1 helix-turn-helix transcriptional regulator [Bacteroides sp. 519]
MENPESISERIAILVKEFGNGRNTTFAALVGSSEGNIRGYINKGVLPKQDVLEKMVKSLGINDAWLLSGKGPMMGDDKSVNKYGEDTVSIPIVDIGAAAGAVGYENSNHLEIEDTIEMPYSMIRRGATYLCIRVRGESMAPTMLDSGYLVVRLLDRGEWQDIVDNHVYVISTVEGSAYVKRLKNRLRERGFIVCMSDNADKGTYPNFNIYQDELHTILRAEWYFTAKMPNIQETYYKKLDNLEKKFDDLQEQLEEVKGKIGIRK